MITYDNPAGWFGTMKAFLDASEGVIRDDLRGFVSALVLPIGESQLNAWTDSVRILRTECRQLIERHPESQLWGIILEYELLRERGRRPDLVILTGCSLNVVEFKGRPYAEQADLDQVAAYARDLAEYHSGSHNLNRSRKNALTGDWFGCRFRLSLA